jgi:hypothetical protein
MSDRDMSERLDRIERSIETILVMQADFEAKDAIRRKEAELRQQKAEAETKQLKRVLLLAIKDGRRSRSRINHNIEALKYNIEALTDSQLRAEARIERLEAQRKSLDSGNGGPSGSQGPNRT